MKIADHYFYLVAVWQGKVIAGIWQRVSAFFQTQSFRENGFYRRRIRVGCAILLKRGPFVNEPAGV